MKNLIKKLALLVLTLGFLCPNLTAATINPEDLVTLRVDKIEEDLIALKASVAALAKKVDTLEKPSEKIDPTSLATALTTALAATEAAKEATRKAEEEARKPKLTVKVSGDNVNFSGKVPLLDNDIVYVDIEQKTIRAGGKFATHQRSMYHGQILVYITTKEGTFRQTFERMWINDSNDYSITVNKTTWGGKDKGHTWGESTGGW